MRVYLSSTLKDLEEERRAVQEALDDQCVVRHSKVSRIVGADTRKGQ